MVGDYGLTDTIHVQNDSMCTESSHGRGTGHSQPYFFRVHQCSPTMIFR